MTACFSIEQASLTADPCSDATQAHSEADLTWAMRQQLQASIKSESLCVLRAAARLEVASSTLAAPALLSALDVPASGTVASVHTELNAALASLKSSLCQLLRLTTFATQPEHSV